MRRFEALVMSQTEPVHPGTLWLRKKHNDIGPKPNEVPPVGMSIWWFGERGWEPLYDLDTRYNLNTSYTYEESDTPILTTVTPYPNVGVVSINNEFAIYDGSRDLASTSCFVNEEGLKKHVDDLQEQINTLEGRVSTLEGEVASLRTTVNSHTQQIASLTNRIISLESNG